MKNEFFESVTSDAVPCGPYTRVLANARDALAKRDEAQDTTAAKILDLLIDEISEHSASLLVRSIRKES